MDHFDDDNIALLLRLKRDNQPPPAYFENFLHEFRRRRRDESLRQPLWRIWCRPAQEFVFWHNVRLLAAYPAGIAAAVVCVAIISISDSSATLLGKNHRICGHFVGLPLSLPGSLSRVCDARRLFGIASSERQPERFHLSLTQRARSATASSSDQFRDILVPLDLVEPRPHGHKSTGKGCDQAREASEISFHSLRQSAVTMLKAAGVSDFMAHEIVGHESAAVSRQYTQLTTNDKRAAMQRLPDVTSA